MLNPNDILFMETTVAKIISDWNTKIKIHTPKPVNEQPNWNHLLKEYRGEILYDTVEVSAERRDPQYIKAEYHDVTPVGKRILEAIQFCVADGIEFGPFSLIQIDDTDDRYQIVDIRDRIGENVISLKKV